MLKRLICLVMMIHISLDHLSSIEAEDIASLQDEAEGAMHA